MIYEYTLEKDNETNSYAVSFPKIQEALTFVEDLKDLESFNKQCIDCLHTAFEIYADNKRKIPLGVSKKGIHIPSLLALKIYLHNSVIESEMKKTDIAKKSGIAQPNFERMLNFKYNPKIEAVEKVLNTLGKKLNISIY